MLQLLLHVLVVCLLLLPSSVAQPVLVSPFDKNYSLAFFTADVPTPYGGLVFQRNNPNTIIIGGNANTADGALYAFPLTRDSQGHITGAGSVRRYASAPQIDGGLAYVPNSDVLIFTGYPTNVLSQVTAGAATPNRTTLLTDLGIDSSVGTCVFVPPTAPGANRLKVLSYNTGQWYDVAYTTQSNGLINLTSATHTFDLSPAEPEGVAYVPAGSPLIPSNSLLLSDYGSGTISVYSADAKGDPIAGTARPFITGLSGALGAVIDPLTGDFIFSTFGGASSIVRVAGFAAPAKSSSSSSSSSSTGSPSSSSRSSSSSSAAPTGGESSSFTASPGTTVTAGATSSSRFSSGTSSTTPASSTASVIPSSSSTTPFPSSSSSPRLASSSSTPPTAASVVGDPQFVGLLGQSFQVHGVDGAVYNLISDALVLVNARFRFLSEGECLHDAEGQRLFVCWSHPGSYLASLAIRTAAGDQLVIHAGAARLGFQSVLLNGVPLPMTDRVLP